LRSPMLHQPSRPHSSMPHTSLVIAAAKEDPCTTRPSSPQSVAALIDFVPVSRLADDDVDEAATDNLALASWVDVAADKATAEPPVRIIDLASIHRHQSDGGVCADHLAVPCEHIMAAAVLIAQRQRCDSPRSTVEALEYCKAAADCSCAHGACTQTQSYCNALATVVRLSNSWKPSWVDLPESYRWDRERADALRVQDREADEILGVLGLDADRRGEARTTASPPPKRQRLALCPSPDMSEATSVGLDTEDDMDVQLDDTKTSVADESSCQSLQPEGTVTVDSGIQDLDCVDMGELLMCVPELGAGAIEEDVG